MDLSLLSNEQHHCALVRYRFATHHDIVDIEHLSVKRHDRIIVATDQGPKLATILAFVQRPQEKLPLKALRIATPNDVDQAQQQKTFEEEAGDFCKEHIQALQIPMKLISVETLPTVGVLVFYFASNDRVDFRTLVRELSKKYQRRIEMRQIGVRDAARQTGGLGLCGRETCCSTFLPEFQPISIRMAKDQNLSLNQQKLSGICGRLRCCLQYEQEVYQQARQDLPKIGKRVITPQGEGRVKDMNVLLRKVRVELSNSAQLVEFSADDITRPPQLNILQPTRSTETQHNNTEDSDSTGQHKKRKRRKPNGPNHSNSNNSES